MTHSALARVAGNVHAPAEARRFVAAFVAEHHEPHAAGSTVRGDDVAMIVSELVTNAVRAGGQTVLVQVTIAMRRLRIEVTDDVAGWPKLRATHPDDPTGRGLPLVAALADGWGVAAVPGTGKQVWAEVRLDD